MRLAAIGLLLIALLSPLPAQAAPACQYTVDTAVTDLSSSEMPYFVVDDPALIAKAIAALAEAGTTVTGDVTRILIAIVNGVYVYGIELDGCLTAPAPVPPSLIPTSGLSGKYAFGTFA